MLRPRVIPCLLLTGSGLYKTRRFKKPVYLGDPINTVKIFNEKEVDELILLDINASKSSSEPNFEMIGDIISEAFIPLCYGGGVSTLEQMRALFKLGVEKVSLNTAALNSRDFVKEAAKEFGSQSIVAAIDIKKTLFGKHQVYSHQNSKTLKLCPLELAKELEEAGAGELMIYSVDRDGMMDGYDLPIIQEIAEAVNIPIICSGGAGALSDFKEAFKSGVSAAAAGSLFVFQGPHKAVLISYPTPKEIESLW